MPLLGLAFLAFFASSLYALGVEDIQYYHRNIYEPWLIGWVVWTVAVLALLIMLVAEVILMKLGRVYKLPSVSLLAASTWNLLIGAATFFPDPFPCGFQSVVTPARMFPDSLYYAALTFGLLLAGIAAIKFNSIDGRLVRLARRMCLLNGILALAGVVLMSLSGCLID